MSLVHRSRYYLNPVAVFGLPFTVDKSDGHLVPKGGSFFKLAVAFALPIASYMLLFYPLVRDGNFNMAYFYEKIGFSTMDMIMFNVLLLTDVVAATTMTLVFKRKWRSLDKFSRALSKHNDALVMPGLSRSTHLLYCTCTPAFTVYALIFPP